MKNKEKIIRKPDSDLEALFSEGHGGELKISDIHNVLAEVPGGADGSNWFWIVELCDGRFAYITGGCDYSGWGCRDWGETKIAGTVKEAIELVKPESYDEAKKPISKQLVDQMKGKQPFGLREE